MVPMQNPKSFKSINLTGPVRGEDWTNSDVPSQKTGTKTGTSSAEITEKSEGNSAGDLGQSPRDYDKELEQKLERLQWLRKERRKLEKTINDYRSHRVHG